MNYVKCLNLCMFVCTINTLHPGNVRGPYGTYWTEYNIMFDLRLIGSTVLLPKATQASGSYSTADYHRLSPFRHACSMLTPGI